MLEAYFDESGTHEGSPVMCVAGYLFKTEQVIHLDREWLEALDQFGLTCFHAADCAHGVREFEKLNAQQRKELTIKLIGIIKRRMEVGIAVSISETDFGKHPANQFERGGPYILGALQVLSGVVAWAEKRSYNGKIAYFFESGHKHQHLAHAVIEMMTVNVSDHLRYYSHTFAGKRDIRALQAADILAYEWQKEMRRLNIPPIKRPMRRSLESLLEQTHIRQHFTAHDLYLACAKEHGDIAERMGRFEVVE